MLLGCYAKESKVTPSEILYSVDPVFNATVLLRSFFFLSMLHLNLILHFQENMNT